MANTELTGLDIGFYVPISGTQTLVAAKRNLELEEGMDPIDVGHAGNEGWLARIAGQQEFSVDFDGVMLLDDGTGSFEASHNRLRQAKRGGEIITVQVRYPFGSNADEGPALIETITLTAPYDAEATIAVSLISAGKLQEVTV